MFNKIVSSAMMLIFFLVFEGQVAASENSAGHSDIRPEANAAKSPVLIASSEAPTDEELLSAKPISRARMDLIWADPPRLKQLAATVKAGGGKATLTFYDAEDNDKRIHEITGEDIRWAQNIEKVVDLAYAAGQEGRFQESMKYYKQALVLAPGGDLFLMSIGTCYVQLGDKAQGLRFLKRAAQISPSNGRIRRNLQAAESY